MNLQKSKSKKYMDIPYYLQITEILRKKINEEEYAIGDKIPTDEELSEHYGLNKITIRRGVNILVKEGLLKSIAGKGTFVISNPKAHDFEKGDAYRINIDDKENRLKIIKFYEREAGKYFGALMKSDEKDILYCLEYCIQAAEKIISYEQAYIAKKQIKNFENYDVNAMGLDRIYAMNELEITYIVQDLNIVQANDRVSKYLNVEENLWLFKLDTFKYIQNSCLEYRISYHKGDQTRFISESYSNI